MKRFFSLIILIHFLFVGSLLAGANKATVSGYLIDASSGESLIGANIYISALNIGATTNAYGFYSLSIPASDSIALVFSYIGYESLVKKLLVKTNLKLNISHVQFGDIALADITLETLAEYFGLIGVAKTNTTNSINVSHYVDGATSPTTWTYSPQKSGYRLIMPVYHKSLAGVFHSIKLSTSTDNETVGFEPLYFFVNFSLRREHLRDWR